MFLDSLYVGNIIDKSRDSLWFSTIYKKIETDNTLLFHLIDAKLNVILLLPIPRSENSNLGIFSVLTTFFLCKTILTE